MPTGRPQLLETPLSNGAAQKKDIRSADLGDALVLQNLVRQKSGAVRKRFGLTALSNSTGTLDMGTGAFIAGGTIFSSGSCMAFTAGSTPASTSAKFPYGIYTYSDALGAPSFVSSYPGADVLDRQGLATFQSNPVDYDVVLCTNGVLVLVALVDNTIWWGAYDASGSAPTYACIRALSTRAITFTSGGISPRLIACGTKAILTYVVSSTTVNCYSLDTTAIQNGWLGPTALTLSGGQAASLGNGVYDVAPIDGDITRFAMTYEKAATNSVSLAIYSSTSPFTQSRLVNFETQGNFNTFASMCLQAKNLGRYWIGYVATAGASVGAVAGVARVGFWNETGPVTGVPGTAKSYATGITIGKIGCCVSNAAAQQIFLFSTGYASGTTAMNNAYVHAVALSDSAGTVVTNGSTATFINGIQLASRPIYEPSIDMGSQGIVCAVYIPSSLQGTHYTLSWDGIQLGNETPPRPLSCIAPRLSKNIAQHVHSGVNFNLPRMFDMPSALGSGHVYAFPMTLSVETFHSAITMQFVELLPRKVPLAADRNGHTLLTAGVPWQFAGQYLNEPNFLMYPEIGTVTPSAAGGSLGTGSYQFIAIWEAYDERGNLHQSATSPVITVSVTGPTGSVQLQVPCPALGGRLDQSAWTNVFGIGSAVPPPRAVLYRTTVGGTLFYRDTSDPAPTANNAAIGGAPLTLTSTQSDASLTAAATAQLIYTTGGVLDNVNPPAARAVALHKSRFWLSGCDEPTQVWPSAQFITGICPGWNEAIAFNATGAVRALSSLDDKLIIFVQRGSTYGIEYVTGDGPGNTGAQSDWSPPQPIASDVGAVDQRSVCSGPFGLLFRSNVGGPNGSGGIHLLTRDLQVQYVSGPVEDTLAANPIVTSMVVHPNAGRVYITCVQNDYASPLVGVRLVWDYVQGGTWSVDALSDPDNSQTGVAGPRHGCIANTPNGPTYHWLSATGRIYRETNGTGANSYTDAGTWITAKYTSAWMKTALSGADQYTRVQIQTDQFDPADLNITLTYDYAPSSYYGAETHTFTAGASATFDRFPQVDVEGTPGNQKAKAIQVTLTDATPTGGPTATTGQGFSFATITVEYQETGEGAYPNLPPAQRF